MRFYDYFEISQHVEIILTVFGLFDLYGRSIRFIRQIDKI